jgi:hypothetical protein
LHSLLVNREINLLSLITLGLDNICQIKTKVLQFRKPKKISESLNFSRDIHVFLVTGRVAVVLW